MIERISIDGADLDLGDVFLAVTIRHGRGGVDEGPMASTCSLRLVNVTGEFAAAFRTEVPIGIYLADDVPRFVGKVTDAALNEDGLSIIATSSLAIYAEREIGAVDWPAETWSARIRRAFNEAGAGSTWSAMVGTWAEQAGTWAVPLDPDPLTIEVGDDDPLLLARPADPTTLGSYLATLLADEAAAIANLPDGTTLVQALTARKDLAAIALDPDVVAFAPEWRKVSDIVNAAVVNYGEPEASVTAEDALSIAEHERSQETLSTDLQLEADALRRAQHVVARGSVSEWVVDDVQLLTLHDTIGIGDPVDLSALPEWAPATAYRGLVEGWEDHLEPDGDGGIEWTQTLALSAPRLSGVGLDWASIPDGLTWADAGSATWYAPESLYA